MGKGMLNFIVIIIIYLIIALPVSYALTISGQMVSSQSNSADFTWQTDNSSTTSVEIGLTTAYGPPFSSNNLVKNHAIKATGLSPQTKYYYRLSSTDGGAFPDEKIGEFTTTDATPPPAVTNFNAQSITKTTASFSWDTSSAADFQKYTLYRDGAKIYDGTQTSYTDINLSAGKSYNFQLSVWDVSGNEGPKVSKSILTVSTDTSSPQILNITIMDSQDTSARIGWQTDDNSTSTVYSRTSTGNKIDNTPGYSKDHAVQITVEKGKTIYYKVNSCNEDGYCKNSTEQGFKGGKDITPPTITVSPFDNSTNRILWYNKDLLYLTGKTEGFAFVQIYVNGGFKDEKTANENGTFTFSNIAIDTGIQTNTIFIKSTDVSKNTYSKTYKLMIDLSKPILNVTLPAVYGNLSLKVKGNVNEQSDIDFYLATPSFAPDSLDAAQSNQGVQLSWSYSNQLATPSSYYIYRDDVIIGSTNSINSFIDKNISKNKNYKYSVSALNSACEESIKKEITINSNITLNQTNPAVNLCTVKPYKSLDNIEGNFTQDISFSQDGTYFVKVAAKDSAGNVAEVKQNILVGTQGPTIESPSPGGSDFFYITSLDSITVRGKTTPNTTVDLWVLKYYDEKPDKTTTSDTNGNFEFKNVNFASASLGSLASFTGQSMSGLPRWVNESTFTVTKNNVGNYDINAWLNGQAPENNGKRFFYLQATNAAGLKSRPYPSYFGTRSCYSGNLSWTILFHPEYQSPQFLSVERLQEGSERMAFFFELKWVGSMDSPNSVQVAADPTITMAPLDTYQLNSEAYNITKMMTSGIDFSNKQCDQTKTKCYYVARLTSPISVLTGNFSFDDWKKFYKSLNNQLKIPIQVVVTYNTLNPPSTVPGTTNSPYSGTQTQTMCADLAFPIDNTKLDFTKLPDWLVNGGVTFLNSSIKNIDTILQKAKPIVDAVGYVCIGSYLTVVSVRIVRTIYQRLQVVGDNAPLASMLTKSKCYPAILNANNNVKDATYLNRLSNLDLYNCYPTLYKLWQAEKNIDLAYRWSCDRIFCASSPAPWTGEPKTPKPDEKEIRSYDDITSYLESQNVLKPNECNADDLTMLYRARKVTCDIKDDKNLIIKNKKDELNGKDQCYLYDNSYWIKKPDSSDNAYTLTLEKVYQNVNPSIGIGGEIKGLTVKATYVDGKDDLLELAIPDTCSNNCKAKFRGSVGKFDYLGVVKKEVDNFNAINSKPTDPNAIIKKQQFTKLGVTYGGKDGDEFDQYILSKQTNLQSRESNTQSNGVKECYCIITGSSTTTPSIVRPFNNAGISNKDDKTPVTWDYRYATIGYIYGDEGDVEANSIPSDEFSGHLKLPTDKSRYDPKLYFKERDQSSNPFGTNHLFDTVTGKYTIPMLNPQSQHLTAISSMCLTGMYQRLKLLRNMLNDIKTCIESAKYTGQYSSEVCKELFSKYVCKTISDAVVSFGSGCSQGGVSNLATETNNPLAILSAGVGGVTEGIQSSMVDFNQRYDNAAMKTLFGGGVGDVAQKMCMASLGYQWDINFNTIMDAAYSTSFATNVMTPTLSRSFMWINPATSKPVYEYRGGLYITPGCDIDGYTASLVCVTKAENSLYKLNCQGTNDCPCLYTQTPVPPYSSVLTGGKITQTVPLDKSFHIVNDKSAYVYDHLKVQLIFADATKKKQCLPDEHQDGVFYSKVSDKTPFNMLGCNVDPLSGIIGCTSGIARDLGFGNMMISSVEFSPGDVAVVGSSFKAIPTLTKTGDQDMCLFWTVYQGDGATKRAIQDTLFVPISETYSGNKYATGVDVFKEGNVPSSVLGTGTSVSAAKYNPIEWGQGFDKTTVKYDTINEPFSPSIEYILTSNPGDLSVFFEDKNCDGVFSCKDDTYAFNSNGPFKPFDNTCVISDTSGRSIKFNQITVPTKYKPDVQGQCKINKVSATWTYTGAGTNSGQSQLSILFEAGQPATNGDCKAGTRFPSGSFTRQFTVSNVASASCASFPSTNGDAVCACDNGKSCKKSECDLNKCASTSTTTGSSSSGSASQFEPISIIDDGNTLLSQDSSLNNAFVLSKNKTYTVLVSKPSTGMDNIKAFNWVIKDDYHVVYNLYMNYEPQTTLINKYKVIELNTASGFDDDKAYTVHIEVHTIDDKVLSLSDKTIYFKKSSGVALGGDCGPASGSTTKGTCQIQDCSDFTKDISSKITDSNTKCSGASPHCCLA